MKLNGNVPFLSTLVGNYAPIKVLPHLPHPGEGWGLGGDLTVSIVNALHVWQLSLPNLLPTPTLAAGGNVGDLTRHLLHYLFLLFTAGFTVYNDIHKNIVTDTSQTQHY